MEDTITQLSNSQDSNPSKRFLKFFGKGSSYFGISIINFILIILTLGLYYPWAKEKIRKYIWNETEMENSRFVFHGTGWEMFKGFVISYLMLILVYGCIFWMQFRIEDAKWVLFLLVFLILFIISIFVPFAIFHAWKYRVSRTSWRGIYFSFNGRFSEFYKIYVKYFFFVIITFGIASPWMTVKLQKYLFSHTKLGDLKLDFHGDGSDLFVINFLGVFLSYITLFIYLPYFIKNRWNFTVNHTTVENNQFRRALKSHLSGDHCLKILFVNFILLIFTLGLAFPFTIMRYYKMLFDHVEIPTDIDFDQIAQHADSYNQAAGDEMSDLLDIDIDF